MIVKQTINVKKQVVSACICDKCRREFNSDDIPQDEKTNSFYLSGRTIAGCYGYGSPSDGDSYSLDLCDLCLEDIIKSIKQPKE